MTHHTKLFSNTNCQKDGARKRASGGYGFGLRGLERKKNYKKRIIKNRNYEENFSICFNVVNSY